MSKWKSSRRIIFISCNPAQRKFEHRLPNCCQILFWTVNNWRKSIRKEVWLWLICSAKIHFLLLLWVNWNLILLWILGNLKLNYHCKKSTYLCLTLGAHHALTEIVLRIQLLKCSRCYQLCAFLFACSSMQFLELNCTTFDNVKNVSIMLHYAGCYGSSIVTRNVWLQ